MTVNNTSFTTASFFTSFTSNNKRRPSLGLPTSPINHSFLQSPLWNTVTVTKPPQQQKSNITKQALQQAIYVLPKQPSNVSIYLQLPVFRSLSVFMRCGHVSKLVENWLCNPMDQLKRNAQRAAYQEQQQEKRIRRKRSSSLCIMPVSDKEETGPLPIVNKSKSSSLVPYYHQKKKTNSTLFIHFQMGQQSEPMEIQYNHVPCLFTIVCVTYHCGSVSISINQIESLDFLSAKNNARLDPFLIKCDLQPNHPVTIHQLTSHHQLPLICSSEQLRDVSLTEIEEMTAIEEIPTTSIQEMTQISAMIQQKVVPVTHIEEKEAVVIQRSEPQLIKEEESILSTTTTRELDATVELLHFKETLLYQQEEDEYDDESCLYSSSEEYSILDDLDTEEEEPLVEDALLRLVQDTLEYIQSNGGALSEELNNLEHKLYNYSCAHSLYN